MDMTPDPYGQAALMLCEGLILLLVEKGTFDKAEASAMVDGIVEVKREIASGRESTVVSLASITLLRTIARSVSAATGPGASLGAD